MFVAFNPEDDALPKVGEGCLEAYGESPHMKATFFSVFVIFMVTVVGMCAGSGDEGVCFYCALCADFD